MTLRKLVLLATLGIALADAHAEAGIRSVPWRDRAYPFGDEVVQLRHGRAEDGGTTYAISAGDVVYGDLDGDGQEDAVVRIKLSSGASLRQFELQAYTFRNGEVHLLARLDDQAVSRDVPGVACCAGPVLRITGQHVLFDVLHGQTFLRPDASTLFDYVVLDGRFVRRGTPRESARPARQPAERR